MKARLVLALWRERWERASDAQRGRMPYLVGRVARSVSALLAAPLWRKTGLQALALVACVFVFALAVCATASLIDQVFLALLWLAPALYVRRHAGGWVKLCLLAMAAVPAARYFYWRFTQSLAYGPTWDFALGYALACAELYLAILLALRAFGAAAPMRRAQPSLAPDREHWPTMDVLLFVHEKSLATVEAAVLACMAGDWPAQKRTIRLIDLLPRDEIALLAERLGVRYAIYPDRTCLRHRLIRQLAVHSGADLVAVSDCVPITEPQFFAAVAGWFVHDSSLALAMSPQNALAPNPAPDLLKLCGASLAGCDYAILRRTAWLEAGIGLGSHQADPQKVGIELHSRGWRCAYVGGANAGDQASATWPHWRIDTAFLPWALATKLRAQSLLQALSFYFPVMRALFFMAPVLALLAEVKLLAAQPAIFLAFALPYWLHVSLAYSRLRNTARASLLQECREAVLSAYMLLITGLGALLCAAQHIWRSQGLPGAGLSVWDNILLALNLWAAVLGVQSWLASAGESLPAALFYALWALGNIAFVLAAFALRQEAAQIRQTWQRLCALPAMLQYASGRTLRCTTVNFPEANLQLSLPGESAMSPGDVLQLSIFHDLYEFSCQVTVQAQEADCLRVSIRPSAAQDYAQFVAAVMARGADWPRWLPGRNADQPLPHWLGERVDGLLEWLLLPKVAWSRWNQKRKRTT